MKIMHECYWQQSKTRAFYQEKENASSTLADYSHWSKTSSIRRWFVGLANVFNRKTSVKYNQRGFAKQISYYNHQGSILYSDNLILPPEQKQARSQLQKRDARVTDSTEKLKSKEEHQSVCFIKHTLTNPGFYISNMGVSWAYKAFQHIKT